jgi:hypothetical protein
MMMIKQSLLYGIATMIHFPWSRHVSDSELMHFGHLSVAG